MTTNTEGELPSQRQRRQEMDRIARLGVAPLPSPFTLKVVGVSFVSSYPTNLDALSDLAATGGHFEEPLPVILVRNPANTYDTNAVEVHVPALGEDLAMIGHLPAPIAARLAPELDAGGQWQAGVTSVLVQPGHEDRPGISIALERIVDDHQH